ncbi:GGDEF domain-containing protein [Bradyrhizobium sp. WBOS7]|uniref:diguanylate cyclase n=2 Tax=Nitrobacteraceae TaxID=41294 RepID=A0AAE9N7F9_9BRAD|nr:GGDEF domain-containing protein [Bradyrhizobium sp. WBOS2]MDD1571044.1 GGDEF domain-containing protein [Bradyrhizobium sp. WBOS1]MDD1577684.1 GGDEF domain-containing protein [Bradyrhizobium sp. WBOS7]MDD1600629.1 GGDEF domain-containing protein [Bradyrhizobium sp. WBOS16]UUO35294.1 GGDEF domain-containing protein [Bradyrhizobium sp. WBOS01]UUO41603.1 GGDEF domain-containing protein [Bradyrhizobium sp. WBOS02]UUO55940.1 GGDEF domain-containing protein [Bradyrhizobium sp. WBOS07]UUO65931.1 
MHYPVLVKPRKPSLSRMPMKKPKRASAAKAKAGRKTSVGRSKAAPKRPTKRPAKPPRRGALGDEAQETVRATIRDLRAKLKQAQRRVAELEAAADTDFLLGIPNRRGFERELARAIAYMKRYRASGALIVLDVDRLKPINDSFGHGAGDEVLKSIVAALTRQVRASDVVGRLGGDEFALLLWNLSETDAKAKAAAFEQAIDELSFVFRGQHVTAGASAGVALLGAQSDAGRALEEADAAMYVRKAHRRHEPRIRLVSS